jgi:hypothetical protein
LRDNSLIFLKSFDAIFYQSNVFKRVNLVTGKLEWQNRLEQSGLSVASTLVYPFGGQKKVGQVS